MVCVDDFQWRSLEAAQKAKRVIRCYFPFYSAFKVLLRNNNINNFCADALIVLEFALGKHFGVFNISWIHLEQLDL